MFDIGYPSQRHFELVGRCINEWASVENALFHFCQFAINADDAIIAVVFFRNVTLTSKFDLTDELLLAIEPPDAHLQSWKRLISDVPRLIKVRNRLAHQGLDGGLYGEKDERGDWKFRFQVVGIRRSQFEYKRPLHAKKRKREEAIDVAVLENHFEEVHALAERLGDLLDAIANDWPSEENSDLAS